jgi:hypothetical protein
VSADKEIYESCLSCDSVLSERIEYSPTSSTTIVKWLRYEYDGLNCFRVDEKYDTVVTAINPVKFIIYMLQQETDNADS